ncbi:hypothetical protein GE09DRAFT_239913 [Coniochaeta sp. 2T2.1]|nr:hypothetical protein GE09DRAFT_239913 [Coniochaeta sp. 2T2.1]
MPPWVSDSDDSLAHDHDELAFLRQRQASPAEDSSGSALAEQDLASPVSQTPSHSPSPSPAQSPSSFTSPPPEAGDITDATSANPSLPHHNLEVQLPKSTLVTPRSRFAGWIPPASRTKEHVAVKALMERLAESVDIDKEGFVEFELDKFCVYVNSAIYQDDLRPLQHLSTKGPDEFYFDGVLSLGGLKFYVERVPFSELPIGNYGLDHASIHDQIWIRSRTHAKHGKHGKPIYYKLKRPALEYERFHTPFLWIADLAKHVIDYSGYMAERNKAVTLRHFKHEFIEWLRKKHKDSVSFLRWHVMHGRDDFGGALTANVEYIWKEACGVLGYKEASSLQVFREVRDHTYYRPFAERLGDKRNPVQPSTIVTPYIYKCFGHTEFGQLLEPLQPRGGPVTTAENEPDFKTADEVKHVEVTATTKAMLAPDFARSKSTRRDSSATRARQHLIASIKPGTTLSTPPDGLGTGTKWKKEVAKGTTDEHRWFGRVQKVHVSPKTGVRTFDVTWLYRPVDTPCCKMVYPWSKELFLSDHCTCEEGGNARVGEDEVLAVHDIDWFGSPETTTAEFFVRQTYQVEQRRWVTLDESHMTCNHSRTERVPYRPGDTVLATLASKDVRADPYEVVRVFKQGPNKFVRLRRLLRRTEVDLCNAQHARPNELVYTDETIVVEPQRIIGRCIVRCFDTDEELPCPYDRNGTANVFFITHKLENGSCVPFSNFTRPSTLRQGFDPKRRLKKLRGLDLFCGSGNFGRGLEEGGVVNMRWTNDIWTEAIHTYMVNAPQDTKPFLGSVDDLLRLAIEGDNRVPKRGDVDFISGGSPCQGFSLITADKTHDRQKKNRSLVASFASFIDFYRPKYGILENVLSIVQSGRGRDEDAFSQLICAIVGMGYQTQLALGDAWTYGAPQSRSRAFIYFAAPGYQLPDPPRPSHSHFDGVKSRGLGNMTNGESFVSRPFEATPFKYVSAAEATADLPDIHDAKPDYCVGYPDHRISMGVTSRSRFQYHCIPTQPYGMTFAKTWNKGQCTMTPADRDLFPHKGLRVELQSKGWGRVNPKSVFQTITTCVTPTDARTGRLLHWQQSRPITILEARRAQGFPDHEVLVGNLASQYELVGNSVARPMALALGLQFREAWLGSLYDDTIPITPKDTGEIEAGLAGLPMNSRNDQVTEMNDQEQEAETDWEYDDPMEHSSKGSPGVDDHDDLVDAVNGADTKVTPPTSVSGSDVKTLPSLSQKRPFPEPLEVEMHISKIQKVEVLTVAVAGRAEPGIKINDTPRMAKANGNPTMGSFGKVVADDPVAASSSRKVLTEQDFIDLTATVGESTAGGSPASRNDTIASSSAVVAGQECVDLTGDADESSTGGVPGLANGRVAASSAAVVVGLDDVDLIDTPGELTRGATPSAGSANPSARPAEGST